MEEEGVHQIVVFNVPTKKYLEQMVKYLQLEQMLEDGFEEAGKVDLEPTQASLRWTRTCAAEEKDDVILGRTGPL